MNEYGIFYHSIKFVRLSLRTTLTRNSKAIRPQWHVVVTRSIESSSPTLLRSRQHSAEVLKALRKSFCDIDTVQSSNVDSALNENMRI